MTKEEYNKFIENKGQELAMSFAYKNKEDYMYWLQGKNLEEEYCDHNEEEFLEFVWEHFEDYLRDQADYLRAVYGDKD